ncbi:MAG: HAD family hydrolase, partial [Terriglobus roseus]|nr:HAD family hydrolase [Terriglobus roseus]
GPGPAALLDITQRYEQAVCEHIAAQWQRLERPALLQRLGRLAPLCVLTNETTRMQLAKWAAVDGEGALFAAFVTSEELGLEKPAPANFLAAAQQLGCEPADCLMVGDDLRCDIEPASALGMQAVWTQEFSPADAPYVALPIGSGVHELSALADLPTLLRQS